MTLFIATQHSWLLFGMHGSCLSLVGKFDGLRSQVRVVSKAREIHLAGFNFGGTFMRHDYKIKVHCSSLNVVRIKLPSDTRVGKSPDAFQGRSHQLVFSVLKRKPCEVCNPRYANSKHTSVIEGKRCYVRRAWR